MLIKEAEWIGTQIPTLPLKRKSVVLNFGSQTLKYNKEKKHLIDFVIGPIRQKCQLKNLDLQEGYGIDYSGDIFDDTFYNKLASIQFDGVLLCNVLEHVENIKGITKRIAKIIKPGGFLIFTGPYEYPKHYDPIDNGFRPEIKEVANLFNNFKIIQAEIVIDYTYAYYLRKNKKLLLPRLVRILTPFYRFNKWKDVVIPRLRWWNKPYKVTCILMQKQ